MAAGVSPPLLRYCRSENGEGRARGRKGKEGAGRSIAAFSLPRRLPLSTENCHGAKRNGQEEKGDLIRMTGS